MTTTKKQHDAGTAALRAGESAVRGLREALARVGIVLPSVRASMPVNGQGHVDLGGCSAGTAVRLAEAVNAAADARPDLRTTGTTGTTA